MAFPPHTWTYEQLTSTLLALLEWRGKPKSRITYPTAQSIANGTWVALTNNASAPTTDYDTDSMVDTTNRRIKVTTPGWYQAIGAVAWAGSTGDVRKTALRKNGTIMLAWQYTDPDASTPATNQAITAPVLCAANDYFETLAYQASGGALSTASSSTEGVSSLAVWMVDSATS